jgi:hypothetical protein
MAKIAKEGERFVTVKLTPELNALLSELAKLDQRPVADIVRRALVHWVGTEDYKNALASAQALHDSLCMGRSMLMSDKALTPKEKGVIQDLMGKIAPRDKK